MILTHFSKNEFSFDPKREYSINRKRSPLPDGIWLSDESQNGWQKFCIENDFLIEKLKYKTIFSVELESIKHLQSKDDLSIFCKTFQINESVDHDFLNINWQSVKKRYKGLLISPYNSDYSLEEKYLEWHSKWDCASACIWDLTSLKLINVDG